MAQGNLRTVEKKVLGAMLILADENMKVKASLSKIAQIMGYKKAGGALTFAIQALEMKNQITVEKQGEYTVLI